MHHRLQPCRLPAPISRRFIKPDQTLYASSVATMPFARPHFKEILAAIDFIVEKDYPARGEA
jgi:hypothetical protein